MTNSVNDNQSQDGNMPMGIQAEDEISLLDLLQTIVDNLRLLVLGPLAAGVTALGISYLIPPTYTAKTQFLPPQQQQSAAASMLASLGSLGGLAGAAVGGIKNPADQYLAYMKSVTLQDSLIERFKLLERYEAKTKTDARLALAGGPGRGPRRCKGVVERCWRSARRRLGHGPKWPQGQHLAGFAPGHGAWRQPGFASLGTGPSSGGVAKDLPRLPNAGRRSGTPVFSSPSAA